MLKSSEIQRHVKTLLEKNNIKTAPVPVEKIAKSLGALIRRTPFDDGLSGMICIRGGTPIIGVNSRHHVNRRRFTIAHEIGHLVLHRDSIINQVHVDRKFPVLMRDASSATGTERIEIEANRFAAELLMPTILLVEILEKKCFYIDDIDIDDIEKEIPLAILARKFRVSEQALTYRIRNGAL